MGTFPLYCFGTISAVYADDTGVLARFHNSAGVTYISSLDDGGYVRIMVHEMIYKLKREENHRCVTIHRRRLSEPQDYVSIGGSHIGLLSHRVCLGMSGIYYAIFRVWL